MEKGIEFQTLDDEGVRQRGGGSLSEAKPASFDRDRYELARVGKQQVLKVSHFSHVKKSSNSVSVASGW